jgi:hypothetical protein
MTLLAQQTVVQVRDSAASPDEWDAFAQRCRASFRSSFRGARAWQLEYHWFCRLRRFDICIDGPTGDQKIGQCAVGVGKHQSVFSDGIHLLPGHDDLWTAALTSIIEQIGATSYVYGSDWSFEACREATLAQIPGVEITRAQRTSIEVIDFSQWPTWADYQRSVSSNIRRNVIKASRAYRDLEIVERSGVNAIKNYSQAMSMRRAMFRRKGVKKMMPIMLLRSVARLLSMYRYSTLAYLVADDALRAFYVGISYGKNFYYLEGASEPNNGGASWYLLMTMIERAYRQSKGMGNFIMGSDDGTQTGTAAWEGLRRSRQQCRATSFETSIVRFSYNPLAIH